MRGRRIVSIGLIGSLASLLLASAAATAGGGPVRLAAAYRDGAKPLDGSALATVYVAAGNWAFVAKATVDYGSSSQAVTCWLDAGGDFDTVVTGNGDDVRSILLIAVHRFPSDGSASVWCDAASGAVARNVRLYGYRVSRLTNRQLPSGIAWTDGSGRPQAIAGWNNGPVALPKGSTVTVGSLALPKGRWWVIGKLSGRDVSSVGASSVSCTLGIGNAASGWSTVRVQEQVGPGESAVLPMEHVRRLVGPGVARVRCHATRDSDASFLKLLAIRAGRLVSGALGRQATAGGSGFPEVRAGWKEGPAAIPIGNAYRDLGSLSLPPGSYWFVLATATIGHTASSPAMGVLDCRLSSDDSPDRLTNVDLTPGTPYRRAGIALAVLHHANETMGIRLRCRAGGAALWARDVRIVAIEAESITWNVF